MTLDTVPSHADPDADSPLLDTPFPLRRAFRRRILPGLLVLVVVMTLSMTLGLRAMVQQIYLDLAEMRADSMAKVIDREAPEGWAALLDGAPPVEIWAGPHRDKLTTAFDEAVTMEQLSSIKIYNTQAVIVFASEPGLIGQKDLSPPLAELLAEDESQVVSKPPLVPDGPEVYELYVPYHAPDGSVRAVFELYEPQVVLDRIVLRTLSLPLGISTVLLVGLILWLGVLVGRAQTDIDLRTNALITLRRRLETLVSRSAATAARQTLADERAMTGQQVDTTLFYSDIRGFTGFAEAHGPAETVAFLNRLFAVQVDIVGRHGGDVDKMIGDALLVRFDGADGARRAIAAALEVQQAFAKGQFPRGIGIGVLSGPVIVGAIGPAARQDYTVIGDSVNLAARLCAAADSDEVVVQEKTLTAAGIPAKDFAPAEVLSVKGRSDTVTVRRWRASSHQGLGNPNTSNMS